MRVIAGTARRLLLKTIEGQGTRPTTDRIKETLFNMIHQDLPGSDFLDLFAGSGAIGIEALSRGAKKCVFVENNRKAAGVIRDNLVHTHLDEGGEILIRDALSAVQILEDRGERFDHIFMDPPYGKLLERDVLLRLSGSPLLKEGGLIIVESDLSTAYDYLEGTDLIVRKEKRYKNNKHTFFEGRRA